MKKVRNALFTAGLPPHTTLLEWYLLDEGYSAQQIAEGAAVLSAAYKDEEKKEGEDGEQEEEPVQIGTERDALKAAALRSERVEQKLSQKRTRPNKRTKTSHAASRSPILSSSTSSKSALTVAANPFDLLNDL